MAYSGKYPSTVIGVRNRIADMTVAEMQQELNRWQAVYDSIIKESFDACEVIVLWENEIARRKAREL